MKKIIIFLSFTYIELIAHKKSFWYHNYCGQSEASNVFVEVGYTKEKPKIRRNSTVPPILRVQKLDIRIKDTFGHLGITVILHNKIFYFPLFVHQIWSFLYTHPMLSYSLYIDNGYSKMLKSIFMIKISHNLVRIMQSALIYWILHIERHIFHFLCMEAACIHINTIFPIRIRFSSPNFSTCQLNPQIMIFFCFYTLHW